MVYQLHPHRCVRSACNVPGEKQGLKLPNLGIYMFTFSHDEASSMVLVFPLLLAVPWMAGTREPSRKNSESFIALKYATKINK